jgi:D-sedoheptulose 7-phosphate isomerase
MNKLSPEQLLFKEYNTFKKSFNFLEKKKLKNFDKLCECSLKAIKNGNKIIFFGNGGSAADAQHLAAELVVKYKKKRKAIPAISLSTDTSIITSIGNDFGFKYIFSRQIKALGKKGDIAIAITTSGNSQNLIEATISANSLGLNTFCLSGNNGGKLKKFVNFPLIFPSKITSIIQVMEILVGQVLCEYLELNS